MVGWNSHARIYTCSFEAIIAMLVLLFSRQETCDGPPHAEKGAGGFCLQPFNFCLFFTQSG